MKKVIEGKIYDTEKAEKLHEYENMDDRGNYEYYEEALYRTKKGNYFTAGEGGPMSKYSVARGGGNWSGGEQIEALSKPEAADWLEAHNGSEILAEDPDFEDLLEEA